VASFPTFDTLIGHEATLAETRSALRRGKPGHSHLFYGPKGVGKAVFAAAFAQILLCKSPVGEWQSGCGHCRSCQKMAGGQHPDFVRVEMAEGKTRISVDQIRALSAFLSLTPMESPWKVALIDDGSQMNEQAANALLKTLEEPPDQSILIINTYRMGALLPTIRSRCIKSRFSALSDGALFEILRGLVTVEESEIEQAVALCGGDVSQALLMCESGLVEERNRFIQELERLNPGTLGELCTMAEYWSQPARFMTFLILFKAWFREQIRDSVLKQERPESIREWLSLSQWAEDIMGQATVINLNRRLVLESLLIKLARLRGATY
jgi:DNA polymerase III subunit delta'